MECPPPVLSSPQHQVVPSASFPSLVAAVEKASPGALIQVQSGWLRGINVQVPGSTVVFMGVSENSGTPKSSILIGFSIINYKPSILGYPYFWKHPHVIIFMPWTPTTFHF